MLLIFSLGLCGCSDYGRLLPEMVCAVPDGIVCFFVSYSYMDQIVNSWNETGILKDIMQHKLVFIETQDVVETTLAVDNYRKACDCGRGAVFFSVARNVHGLKNPLHHHQNWFVSKYFRWKSRNSFLFII
ncbi:hypothetical protein L1049_001208 [Liquidambar formosana]|uniref:ATP-dependent helicase C-terminal domain-containing protein n=1 Tax=Liquidambar formosana TaxID=63359 RepID=A0AAP0NCW4_LIQFO